MASERNQLPSELSNAEEHWGTRDPATLPTREMVAGLPRLVLETRVRLGPLVSPEEVAQDLQARGVNTTTDAVREVWDEGHQDE